MTSEHYALGTGLCVDEDCMQEAVRVIALRDGRNISSSCSLHSHSLREDIRTEKRF